MGVRGLTTYIAANASVYLKPYELHDTSLVIDGDNLCLQLFRKSLNNSVAFGGNYDVYYRIVVDFFDKLKLANVTPYVLLDGGYEKRKMSTVRYRLLQKVEQMKGFHIAAISGTPPPMLREVFVDALRVAVVSFMRCPFEADDEVAILARKLNCPLLSYDSDFYIHDVQYIPYVTLSNKVFHKVSDKEGDNFKIGIVQRKQPKKAQHRTDGVRYVAQYGDESVLEGDGTDSYSYLDCCLYKIDNLIEPHDRLGKEMVPLFAVLLGNDYIGRGVLKPFFEAMQISHINRKFFRHDRRIKLFLKWLQKHTLESATLAITRCIKQTNKRRVYRQILTAMRGYNCEECTALKWLQKHTLESATLAITRCIKQTNKRRVYRQILTAMRGYNCEECTALHYFGLQEADQVSEPLEDEEVEKELEARVGELSTEAEPMMQDFDVESLIDDEVHTQEQDQDQDQEAESASDDELDENDPASVHDESDLEEKIPNDPDKPVIEEATIHSNKFTDRNWPEWFKELYRAGKEAESASDDELDTEESVKHEEENDPASVHDEPDLEEKIPDDPDKPVIEEATIHSNKFTDRNWPEWFKELYRAGKVPRFLADLLHSNLCINYPQIEDLRRPDSNTPSYPILRTIFAILKTAFNVKTTEFKYLTRRKGRAGVRNVYFRDVCLPQGVSFNPTKLPNVSILSKLFQQSGIETWHELFRAIKTVPNNLRLYFLAIIYWTKNCPLVNAAHVHAVIICLLQLQIIDKSLKSFYRDVDQFRQQNRSYLEQQRKASKKNDGASTGKKDTASPSATDFNRTFYNKLTSGTSRAELLLAYDELIQHFSVQENTFGNRKGTICPDTMHTLAIFQAVCFNLYALVPLLGYPFDNLHMHELYNNLYVYNVYEWIKARGDLFEFERSSMFAHSPALLTALRVMVEFVQTYVPELKDRKRAKMAASKGKKSSKVSTEAKRILEQQVTPANDWETKNDTDTESDHEAFIDENNAFSQLLLTR
uniref:XPG_I_2 domain-containing protein n=1 Tax=Anopheles maculatus TaxID=74869 RepID=A0A182S925_9DIPT